MAVRRYLALPLLVGVVALLTFISLSVSSSINVALARPVQAVTFIVTFTVNSTADPGDGVCDATECTLREAINAANAALGKDTIAFNITTTDPGYMTSTPTWWRIQPASALPTITDPVVIDGYTQPGASPNTNPVESLLGLNTVLKIELDGSNAGAGVNGLHVTAGNSVLRGLVINRFGNDGIVLSGNGGSVIEGNLIGTDVTGTADLGNAFAGVYVPGAPDNTIGGTTSGGRNVISGNNGWGVIIFGSGATGNLVQGNLIGTDATGAVAVGNGWDGVDIDNAPDNTIGGTKAEARNVISANNWGSGVRIIGSGATGNLVQGNFIGTDVTGTNDLGNSFNGVSIHQPPANTIGGTASGAGNTIAFNGGDGVFVETGTGNAILGNSIFSNGGMGIDLDPGGFTPNDPGDADTGANNLQNFPVLSSALSGSNIIQGTLNSSPQTTFRLEFFSNGACDTSGYGEGETFLGFTDVATDGSGNASFSVSLPTSLSVGQFITATATDLSGNTSEFSSCLAVAALPTPTPTLTTTTVSGPPSVQYSDTVTLTATVSASTYPSSLTGSVEFKIGSQTYGSVNLPGGANSQTVTLNIPSVKNSVGTYTVTATFTPTGGSNYAGSSNSYSPLEVYPECITPTYNVTYTGAAVFWTTSPTSSTATLNLSASIRACADGTPGDLTTAKVTFGKRNSDGTVTPITSNLPVGLADPSDPTTGVASAIVQYNLDSKTADNFELAVTVGGNYAWNSAADDVMLTVAVPVPGGQIVGDGHLPNGNSIGVLKGAPEQAGEPEEATAFAFYVKYNKSLTNPQGKMVLTIHSYNKPNGTPDTVLHAYQVSSNAIATLQVDLANHYAMFTSKANIVDITDLNNPVSVDGGANLQVTMHDLSGAGSDTLGITVYNSKTGGLWYSSNWVADSKSAKTMESVISDGDISVK